MTVGYADLHLHTIASDGTQTVADLARRAAASSLSTIAVTDHDRISPDLRLRVERIGPTEVITGVEIKADFEGVRGELLGYFVDPTAPGLARLFEFMEEGRLARMAEMVERCRQELSLELTFDDVASLAAGSLGRPHLAQLLVMRRVVRSTDEAFERFLGRGKPCYVPLRNPGFRDVAQAIGAAGGVASVAHPCLMDIQDWDGFLSLLDSEGVQAIEAFYPYELSRARLRLDPALLLSHAERHGFLLTGGSDDHGPGSVKEALGAIRLPLRYVDALREACGV